MNTLMEMEMSDELVLEHEAITQRVLEVNPGIDKMVAGLRAMRIILQLERETCCDVDFAI